MAVALAMVHYLWPVQSDLTLPSHLRFAFWQARHEIPFRPLSRLFADAARGIIFYETPRKCSEVLLQALGGVTQIEYGLLDAIKPQ
jgi:hypothetical protein